MRNALAEMNIANGWDVVATAKPDAPGVSYAVFDETMKKSLARLGIRIHPTGSSTGNLGTGV